MAADRVRMLGPREWVGKAAFPWPPVAELGGGAPVVACYSVVSCQKDLTKAGKPYYRLHLTDCNGAVEARVWDPVAEVMAAVRQGVYVGVRGTVELFNGARQIKISDIHPLEITPEDLELFLPHSERDLAEMEAELETIIASIRDPDLRELLARLLGAESETGRQFRRAPAAKQNHHACIGGLLEHTLSVTGSCALMAQHYAGMVDRDLLITGALLHDLGKIKEIRTDAGFPYTDEGKLLGHILLGLQMVSETARQIQGFGEEKLLLVRHLIASHQGRYEWQSPREPRILEALVLHYCDDLDAKMNQAAALLRSAEGAWTAYDRGLGREFFRHGPGEDAAPEPHREEEPENGQAPRRRVRFAGKVAHGDSKATGAPRSTRAPAAANDEPGAHPIVDESGSSPLPAPPEALPPRRVPPPDDVLPPDPHSLDLFS